MNEQNISEKHKAMVGRLAKPGEKILASLTPWDCHLIHMAGCLPGEASEIFDVISGEDTEASLIEELGDFEFYLVAIRETFSIERVVELSARVDPIRDGTNLMVQCGHLWDVVKRVTVYRKEFHSFDKKVGGTLEEAGVRIIRKIEKLFYSLLDYYEMPLEDVLAANWYKLANADTGRYASGSYSDEQAQDRRDTR